MHARTHARTRTQMHTHQAREPLTLWVGDLVGFVSVLSTVDVQPAVARAEIKHLWSASSSMSSPSSSPVLSLSCQHVVVGVCLCEYVSAFVRVRDLTTNVHAFIDVVAAMIQVVVVITELSSSSSAAAAAAS